MSFETGLRGVNAAMRGMDRAAFDIARASNQRLGQQPPAETAQAPAFQPGAAVPPAQRPSPAPEIDLPGAMVDMIASSRAVMANLQTIKRTDEALESLLKLR
jgi:flagellar hook-associated protein FlgK